MSSCPICPRTAPDGQHLCLLHSGELRGWLAELPRQAKLLEQFVAPSGRPAEGRLGGTGRADAPVPVDLRVLVLLGPGRFDAIPGSDDDGGAPIASVLGAWAGHIAYQYPAAARDPHGVARTQPCSQAWPTHGPTITGWCNWLLAYLPFALTLPIAAELHRQVDDLISTVRSLTHATPRHHPQGAPCPECDAFALVRTDGQWEMTCRFCGHHLEPDAYDLHAAQFLQAHQAANDSPQSPLDKIPT